MKRSELLYLGGVVLVAALLIANLFKPTAPHAYDLQSGGGEMPVQISASGDSAWAIIGTKVYYLSLRSRAELPAGQRSINVIDSRSLE